MSQPTPIYNDNRAFVLWSQAMTTRKLKYTPPMNAQIRENGVCEMVQNEDIKILHVQGKINPSDIFTKEDRDVDHYCRVRDTFLIKLQIISYD